MLRNHYLVLSCVFISTTILISFLMLDNTITQVYTDFTRTASNNQNQLVAIALLLVLLLALDIFLPVPSSLISIFAATYYGFAYATLIVFSGMCLGAIIGYFLGSGLLSIAPSRWLKEKDIASASKLSLCINDLALVTMRGVPILAETSVVASGMRRYPFWRFLFITGAANLGIALIYASVGSSIQYLDSIGYIILASILVPILACSFRILIEYFRSSPTAISEGQYESPHTLCENLIEESDTKPNSNSHKTYHASFAINYSYDVIYNDHIFSPINSCLSDTIDGLFKCNTQSPALVIIDSGVIDTIPQLKDGIVTYFASYQKAAVPFILSNGELNKTQTNIDKCINAMLQNDLDRQSCVIAVGGGALLDTVGFACSIFHRGVRYIRVPTTTLAQNDAGIGVKNGINGFEHKNLLGCFAPPAAVINDIEWLKTLSERDKRAGMAEAIKVSLIKDKEFFLWLEDNRMALARFETNAMSKMIKTCADCHLDHIVKSDDPFERGNTRPLDFGHWSAHKLEKLSNHQLKHGEAVAIGIAIDLTYALLNNLIDNTVYQRCINVLCDVGFKLWHPCLSLLDEKGNLAVLNGIEEFRQHLGGELSIPIVHEIGSHQSHNSVDFQRFEQAIVLLKKKHQNLAT
ncbi:3-dehydroquinate synthase [Vibrio sp. Vb2880]|uniref:3-dehydroquinate synthase n=1 Tax=Vibrio sp. Vb2880 TaxID=2816076 RepID=UPI002964C98A|nr:3-dehydroquinate synthase [Vibrio sp. Vb2880]MDW1576528.1 3-dehydroquinate synthase [Vibrio sp. Vb2880]